MVLNYFWSRATATTCYGIRMIFEGWKMTFKIFQYGALK